MKERRLQIYDAAVGYSLVSDTTFSNHDWDSRMRDAGNFDLLYFDAEKDRLFVGPFEIDPATGKQTGRSLARGQAVIGVDRQSDVYWAAGVEGKGVRTSNVVVALDGEMLKTLQAENIGGGESNIRPTYAIDFKRRLLYVGWMTKAEIQVFAMGKVK
jgi:hypothetical protein